MGLYTVLLSVLFFTLLGAAYVIGYGFVKKYAPDRLVQFYLMLAAIRMLLVATVVAIYVMLSQDRQDSIHFAAMFLGMYAVMMVITLILKH